MDPPDTEKNILFDDKYGAARFSRVRCLISSSSRFCVRAATVAKIFEKLSDPAFDSSFTFECVVTFPMFCTASEFLEGLVRRYAIASHLDT